VVPAGWFACGESRTSYTTFAPHDRWVDGLVVRAHPVTVREHLAFLNDVLARDSAEAAWRVVPRERASQAGALGPPNVALEGDRFVRRPDADGDLWSLDWPMLNLDWSAACALARWEAARTGLPWRLPGEFEWEKAARGVDGRAFAWGDHPEPTYACVREAAPARPLPAAVQDFPHDISPYGVRHTVGNVREWCATPFSPVGAPARVLDPADDPAAERVLRGGCWFQSLTAAWAAGRFSLGGSNRSDILGFRLVRDGG
jgi:serine/threonine-protein kinase